MIVKRFLWMKALPLVILLAGMAAFFYFRLYEYTSFHALKTHREILLQWSQQHFILVVVSFILIYALLTAISVPGVVFLTIGGGFLFGPFWATLFVAIGATSGAAMIFLAAKTALSDFLYQKAGGWFKKLSAGFKDNAVSYLLFLRLVPLFPFFIVNIVPAFLGIRFRTFVLTTFFGILPGTFVYALLGHGIGVVFGQGKTPDLNIIFKPAIFFPILGLAILALVPIIYKRLRK